MTVRKYRIAVFLDDILVFSWHFCHTIIYPAPVACFDLTLLFGSGSNFVKY